MAELRIRRGSAWSQDTIEQFLSDSVIPIRLAAADSGGSPIVMSLWYLYRDGSLWCATQADARLVAMLREHDEVGYEIAGDTPPYHGVRGQGRVTLSTERGPTLLEQLIDRYLGRRDSRLARWLLARRDDEIAIQIRPTWLTSWDYRERMENAVATG